MMNYTAKKITVPGTEFHTENRYWQGCPTLCRTKNGTLYAGWYSGGTMEPSQWNYNLLIRSRDDGFSWSEPLFVVQSNPEAKRIAIDIQLWLDPLERMWLFWVERRSDCHPGEPEHMGTFGMYCEHPDAEHLIWSEPEFLAPGFLRCRPTVLSDGRWLLPAYDWISDRYSWSESSDQGKTWIRKHGGKKLETPFDESMFYEDREHRIHLLARSAAGCIAESVSEDGGKTWTDGTKTDLNAPSSRLFVRRLPSGRLLLIHNETENGTRANMTAKLSDDDGKSWPHKLLLDSAEPVSYPDAVCLDDGSILAIYDHGRTSFREILCARFTEDDILAGKLLDHPYTKSYLHHIISKAPVPADRTAYQAAQERDKAWCHTLWGHPGAAWCKREKQDE